MSLPEASATAMQQPARPVSAFAAEQLWRCVCVVLRDCRGLTDDTVKELSWHARELLDQIPLERREQMDAERLARARGQ